MRGAGRPTSPHPTNERTRGLSGPSFLSWHATRTDRRAPWSASMKTAHPWEVPAVCGSIGCAFCALDNLTRPRKLQERALLPSETCPQDLRCAVDGAGAVRFLASHAGRRAPSVAALPRVRSRVRSCGHGRGSVAGPKCRPSSVWMAHTRAPAVIGLQGPCAGCSRP